MEQKEIIRRNKLLAEFIGKKVYLPNMIEGRKNQVQLKSPDGILGNWPYCNIPEFNNNWNWLMLVVEKIESIGHDSYIACFSKSIYSCLFQLSSNAQEICYNKSHSKIESVFMACSDFVEQYKK